MWMAGHRHKSVVTPQPYTPGTAGQTAANSFWEVETASLRDFPQEFRTFDVRRNSDNTVLDHRDSDIDPAVTPGSPAAKSRGYGIGASRIYGMYPITDTTSHAYNAELVKQLTPTMQAVIANCGIVALRRGIGDVCEWPCFARGAVVEKGYENLEYHSRIKES